MNHRELLLDRVKVASATAISNQALAQHARWSAIEDFARDSLILKLQSEVLSHKVAQSTYTMTVPYPDGPWQAFKYKYRSNPLMAWWIVRRPVKHTRKSATVTLSKDHRFPESQISYPDSLGKVVVVEQGEISYE